MATRRVVPRLMVDMGGNAGKAASPPAATVLESWALDKPCVIVLRPSGSQLGFGMLGSGLSYPGTESLSHPDDDLILPTATPDGRTLSPQSEERREWMGYITLADVKSVRRWRGRCDRVTLVAHRAFGGPPIEVYVDPAELPTVSHLRREYLVEPTDDGDAVLVRLGGNSDRPAWFIRRSELPRKG